MGSIEIKRSRAAGEPAAYCFMRGGATRRRDRSRRRAATAIGAARSSAEPVPEGIALWHREPLVALFGRRTGLLQRLGIYRVQLMLKGENVSFGLLELLPECSNISAAL